MALTAAFAANLAVNTLASSSRQISRCRLCRCASMVFASRAGRRWPRSARGLGIPRPGGGEGQARGGGASARHVGLPERAQGGGACPIRWSIAGRSRGANGRLHGAACRGVRSHLMQQPSRQAARRPRTSAGLAAAADELSITRRLRCGLLLAVWAGKGALLGVLLLLQDLLLQLVLVFQLVLKLLLLKGECGVLVPPGCGRQQIWGPCCRPRQQTHREHLCRLLRQEFLGLRHYCRCFREAAAPRPWLVDLAPL
jgi:hypothetical protein